MRIKTDGDVVERRHPANRFVRPARVTRHIGLDRRRHHARSKRLREDNRVSGTGSGDFPDPSCRDFSENDEPEFRFFIFDTVPPRQEGSGFRHLFHSSLKNRLKDGQIKFFRRECNNIERNERPTAHRVRIAQGIRCRNGAPLLRIIDDRSDEINGQYSGAFAVDHPDGSVFSGVPIRQKEVSMPFGQRLQNFRQVRRTYFSGSPTRSRHLRQAHGHPLLS